jgi:hypothetical protein
VRGRNPARPEFDPHLEGSEQARERLGVILEVATGRCRVGKACERLGLSPSRLEQLRRRAWQGALAALEPRPGGRPRRQPDPQQERVAELEARVRELERELAVSRAREELACLPRPEKKTTGPRKRTRCEQGL